MPGCSLAASQPSGSWPFHPIITQRSYPTWPQNHQDSLFIMVTLSILGSDDTLWISLWYWHSLSRSYITGRYICSVVFQNISQSFHCLVVKLQDHDT